MQAGGGLRPWHFFLVASALLATVTVLVMHGQPPERLLLAVATVAAAGYAGHSLYRTLSPLVSEGVGEDATMVAGRTRAALERDKMLTLRAIKELEFDRAMGKIADGDFDVMRDRLRARALRLITQLDGAAAYREMIERDLAARLPAEPAARGAGGCADGREAGLYGLRHHERARCPVLQELRSRPAGDRMRLPTRLWDRASALRTLRTDGLSRSRWSPSGGPSAPLRRCPIRVRCQACRCRRPNCRMAR